MKNKLFFKKKILILILAILFIPLNVNSEIIKKFEIKGNDRVSNQTIVIFSNLKIGDDVNQNNLNNALKEIFSTNYFKDVNLSLKDGVVKINVLENPIIQSVHLSCYKKWINKCKEKHNSIIYRCVYCQNYKTIYRKKKFCCMYYKVKIL